VAEAETPTNGRPGRRTIALLATYVAAVALGYGLGVAGLLPYGPLKASTSTPLARLGLALKSDPAKPNAANFDAALADDVATVRSTLGAPERDAFDLVVALRGLLNGGRPDLARAAQSCHGLAFPRCDQRALEVVGERSRP
jgi:hypothetical protein